MISTRANIRKRFREGGLNDPIGLFEPESDRLFKKISRKNVFRSTILQNCINGLKTVKNDVTQIVSVKVKYTRMFYSLALLNLLHSAF